MRNLSEFLFREEVSRCCDDEVTNHIFELKANSIFKVRPLLIFCIIQAALPSL